MMVETLFNRTDIIHMSTSMLLRLNILRLMLKIIAFFIRTLFARLDCYSHMDITCMTAPFHKEGCFEP